ncbi:LOW QUALITY PROTEIN: hypothetical protein Cgig2_025435 [Carnegiea gigantea]|uniref:Uncharacterized protein n=1 Tax=Carnegiea gigantea TaxID=171969 RepID=A0A9Q1QLF7_9CARY|nr:LOW QUALITY PROTEIN: hypothetical protein Cgig2_025435 [Carnegiea gigantea]
MRPKGLGSCKGEHFERWSQPPLSSVRAPFNRGCCCMVIGFSKPGSGRRRHQRKVQGPVHGKRVRRWSQRVRAQLVRGWPPLLMTTNRDGHVAERNWLLGSWEYLPFSQLSLCPFYKYNFIILYMMFRYPSFKRKWYNGRGGKIKNDWYAYFPFHYGVFSLLQHQGDSRLWSPSSGAGGELYIRLTPLLEDYHVLCPRFSFPEAEGAAANFELPEMVQAIFYAMLLNEVVELGLVHDFIAEGLKSALVGLRWSSFEAWMSRVDHELREAQLWQ